MKKIVVFLLISLFAFSALTGCGNSENNIISEDVNITDAPTFTPTEAPTSEPTQAPTPTPEPHTHSYTESVTKEATCTDEGTKSFTCECGDVYTESIDVIGHNYTEVADSAVEATCTTDGKKADKACECGDTVTGDVVKATGHSWGEYTANGDATYDADGTKTAVCDICGEKDTVTDAGSKLERPKYTYTDMNKTMYAKSSVNVRDLPSTDGNKLGGLSFGQAVTVTGKCNETGWFRIDYNGNVAYVSNSYLQNDKPVTETPTPSPEPTPSDPSDFPNTTTLENWRLGDDGVYYSDPSTNIVADWEGQTLAEYCAARGIIGVTFTDPWYGTAFLNVDRWGDYVIGSRWLFNIVSQGHDIWVQSPF